MNINLILCFGLTGNGGRKMKPFEKCPICGGEVVEKYVEKLFRGGLNTAVVKASAEIYLHCGERLYSDEIVKRFDASRSAASLN